MSLTTTQCTDSMISDYKSAVKQTCKYDSKTYTYDSNCCKLQQANIYPPCTDIDSLIVIGVDSDGHHMNCLPQGLHYVRHLKSSGGPHKMALHMHIGWLKALGAPSYYTCQQMVKVECNGQNLMCEEGGCTMSSGLPGEAPCAFDCSSSGCEACEKKSKSGGCTPDVCIPNEGGGGRPGGGGGNTGDPGNWSTDQKDDIRTHLKQTFPDIAKLEHFDMHKVNEDDVINCSLAQISNQFSYSQLADDSGSSDDPAVTNKILSIMVTCVNSHSTGGGGTPGGTPGGGKGLSTGAIIGIVAGSLLLLGGLIALFMSRKKNRGRSA